MTAAQSMEPAAALRGGFAGRQLAWVAAAALALGGLLGGAELAGVPAGELTPDPNALADQPAHVGLLSLLGLLVWGGAVAALLVAALALRGLGGEGAQMRFLMATGAILLVIGVDDAAMVHERFVLHARLGYRLPRRLAGR